MGDFETVKIPDASPPHRRFLPAPVELHTTHQSLALQLAAEGNFFMRQVRLPAPGKLSRLEEAKGVLVKVFRGNFPHLEPCPFDASSL